MHFIFGTRGIYQNVSIWKTLMQSQFWSWKRTNLNVCECGRNKTEHNESCPCKTFKPREEITSVQGALRPIQLWEYVVPEEAMPEVLNNMGLSGDLEECGHLGKWGSKLTAVIRKLLKLEPMPKINITPQKTRVMNIEGVAVFPIGIKKDFKREHNFGSLGSWFQEGL